MTSNPQSDVLSKAIDFLKPLSVRTDEAENSNVTTSTSGKPCAKQPITPISAGTKTVSFRFPMNEPDREIPSEPFSTVQPRSILRLTGLVVPIQEEAIPPFSLMLQNSGKALASDDLNVRNEGYIVLRRRILGLVESEIDPDSDRWRPGLYVPETESADVIKEALQSSVIPFAPYFMRDMASLVDPSADTRLSMSALKCLLCYLRGPDTTDLLSTKFYLALLDLMIDILTRPGPVLKFIAKSVVLVLDSIAYRTNIIPLERYRTLLESMVPLRHVKSNGVFSVRIAIYSGLILEGPHVMTTLAPIWIPDIFEGFLSPTQELRTRAIRLGEFAGHMPVKDGNLCNALTDFFRTKSPLRDSSTSTYFSFFLVELRKMIRSLSIEERRDAPRIWSIVILMLRQYQNGVEKCGFFKPMLTVLQTGLNSPAPEVRIRSFVSLNTLVYAVMPTEKTDRAVRRLLVLPVTERISISSTKDSAQAQKVWQAAMLSWDNLLYYAFRPGSNDAALTMSWTEYVTDPVKKVGRWKIQAQSDFISRVLSCLFWQDPSNQTEGEPKWMEDRAVSDLGLDGMSCLPEELPQLPPRWIRTNLGLIFPVLECLFVPELLRTTEIVADEGDDYHSPVLAIFPRLVDAVMAAGAREILPTLESESAYIQLCEFLEKIWVKNVHVMDRDNIHQFLDLVGHIALASRAAALVLPTSVLRRPVADSDSTAAHPVPGPIHSFIRLFSLVRAFGKTEKFEKHVLNSALPKLFKQAVPFLNRAQYLQCLAEVVHTIMSTPFVTDKSRQTQLLNGFMADASVGCERIICRNCTLADVKNSFAERLARITKDAGLEVNQAHFVDFYHSFCAAMISSTQESEGSVIVMAEVISARLLDWESAGIDAVELHSQDAHSSRKDRTIAMMSAVLLRSLGKFAHSCSPAALQAAKDTLFGSSRKSSISRLSTSNTTPPTALDVIANIRPAWAGLERNDPFKRMYELIRCGIAIQVQVYTAEVFAHTVSHITRLLDCAHPFGAAMLYHLTPTFVTILEQDHAGDMWRNCVTELWVGILDCVTGIHNRSWRFHMIQFLGPVWTKYTELLHPPLPTFETACGRWGWSGSVLGVLDPVNLPTALTSPAASPSCAPSSKICSSPHPVRLSDQMDIDMDISPSISKRTPSKAGLNRSTSTSSSASGTPYKSPVRAQLEAQIHAHHFPPTRFAALISSPVHPSGNSEHYGEAGDGDAEDSDRSTHAHGTSSAGSALGIAVPVVSTVSSPEQAGPDLGNTIATVPSSPPQLGGGGHATGLPHLSLEPAFAVRDVDDQPGTESVLIPLAAQDEAEASLEQAEGAPHQPAPSDTLTVPSPARLSSSRSPHRRTDRPLLPVRSPSSRLAQKAAASPRAKDSDGDDDMVDVNPSMATTGVIVQVDQTTSVSLDDVVVSESAGRVSQDRKRKRSLSSSSVASGTSGVAPPADTHFKMQSPLSGRAMRSQRRSSMSGTVAPAGRPVRKRTRYSVGSEVVVVPLTTSGSTAAPSQTMPRLEISPDDDNVGPPLLAPVSPIGANTDSATDHDQSSDHGGLPSLEDGPDAVTTRLETPGRVRRTRVGLRDRPVPMMVPSSPIPDSIRRRRSTRLNPRLTDLNEDGESGMSTPTTPVAPSSATLHGNELSLIWATPTKQSGPISDLSDAEARKLDTPARSESRARAFMSPSKSPSFPREGFSILSIPVPTQRSPHHQFPNLKNGTFTSVSRPLTGLDLSSGSSLSSVSSPSCPNFQLVVDDDDDDDDMGGDGGILEQEPGLNPSLTASHAIPSSPPAPTVDVTSTTTTEPAPANPFLDQLKSLLSQYDHGDIPSRDHEMAEELMERWIRKRDGTATAVSVEAPHHPSSSIPAHIQDNSDSDTPIRVKHRSQTPTTPARSKSRPRGRRRQSTASAKKGPPAGR